MLIFLETLTWILLFWILLLFPFHQSVVLNWLDWVFAWRRVLPSPSTNSPLQYLYCFKDEKDLPKWWSNNRRFVRTGIAIVQRVYLDVNAKLLAHVEIVLCRRGFLRKITLLVLSTRNMMSRMIGPINFFRTSENLCLWSEVINIDIMINSESCLQNSRYDVSHDRNKARILPKSFTQFGSILPNSTRCFYGPRRFSHAFLCSCFSDMNSRPFLRIYLSMTRMGVSMIPSLIVKWMDLRWIQFSHNFICAKHMQSHDNGGRVIKIVDLELLS